MTNPLEAAYSIDRFRRDAHQVVDALADHLESSLSGNQSQALPWVEPEKSLEHWRAIAEEGIGMVDFCHELIGRSVRISDPKFMGHQICAPAPTAIIAGFITDCLNNGSGVYEMGMAGTAMEKVVLQIVAKQLGFSSQADGVMTSGGTLANLTAMLAARAVKSEANDWSDGTHQQLCVMVSEQAHYCIDRAVRIMGWGDSGIVFVPTNDQFAMDTTLLPELFQRATEAGRKVIGIVGSACSTSTGAFDDLVAIGEFCKGHDLWFHVDGAHGAAVAFSDSHRHLVEGIDSADSVVMDFHKMMMTPVISSAVLFRKKADSFRSFAVEADYLFSKSRSDAQLDDFNLAKRTFECTKTMLSAKVFSLLSVHGLKLFEANVDRLHARTREFADLLRAHENFELAAEPQTNIVCYRFVNRSDCEQNRINDQIRDSLTKQGKYYIVKTKLHGQTWLRSTIANPFTSVHDMQGLLDAILEAAARHSRVEI